MGCFGHIFQLDDGSKTGRVEAIPRDDVITAPAAHEAAVWSRSDDWGDAIPAKETEVRNSFGDLVG